MSRFHVPYNFVPVTGECNGNAPAQSTAVAAIADGSSGQPARHDLWQANTLSGRMLCRLTTTSPLVIGAEQEHKDEKGEVIPFKRVIPFSLDGQPAIPGSSLRGLIGNLIETLSQSSLRVLQDRRFSVRKPADARHTLSAVGRLSISNGHIQIQPLTLPIHYLHKGQASIERKWDKVFGLRPDNPIDFINRLQLHLPAYLHGYRSKKSLKGSTLGYDAGSFLARNRTLQSSTAESPTWMARLDFPALAWDGKRRTITATGTPPPRMLVARLQTDPLPVQTPLPAGQTSGHFKILGIDGRETEMADTKEHELFVLLNTGLPALSIHSQALDDLNFLLKEADAREDYLPFLNKGCSGIDIEAHARVGQLVFFDVDEQGQVQELSFSGIWRKASRWKLFEAFRKSGSTPTSSRPNIVPFSPLRSELTPAERLLGVVSQDDPESPVRSPLQALASRIRFTSARPFKEIKLEAATVLQVLNSPKPPSPALYFSQRPERYRKKIDFVEQSMPIPNGRKFYLPHPPEQRTMQSASSGLREPEREKLKMSVNAIPAQTEFSFEVSFENLTPAELELLLCALRPGRDFEHRLGLGKALGLGHAKIEVVGIGEIDRPARYSAAGMLEPRFSRVWRDEHRLEAASVHAPLLDEFRHSTSAQPLQADDPVAGLNQVFKTATTLVDAQTLAIVQTIGNVNRLAEGLPVCSPRTAAQLREGSEDELFQWAMANDKDTEPQHLAAVRADQQLPTLKGK